MLMLMILMRVESVTLPPLLLRDKVLLHALAAACQMKRAAAAAAPLTAKARSMPGGMEMARYAMSPICGYTAISAVDYVYAIQRRAFAAYAAATPKITTIITSRAVMPHAAAFT